MPRENDLSELFPDTILQTEDGDEGAAVEEKTSGGLTAEQLAEILENQRNLTIAAVDRTVNGGRASALQQDDLLPQIGAIPMEGLPNPAIDFQGFHKEYMARAAAEIQRVISGSVSKVQERAGAMMEQKTLLARAEQMIQDAAPEIPQYIRDQAAKDVASQFVDPYAELQRDIVGVSQKVLDRSAELVAEISGQKPAVKATRTAGLLPTRGGVNPAARRAAIPTVGGADKPGDMVKELRALQQKARIY